MRKYRNQPIMTEYGRFDSKKEYERWIQLKLMERGRVIADLDRQVKFNMIVNGQKVCSYIADYVYTENGQQIVEDCKSPISRKEPVYRLKNKLMKAIFGIEIKES